MIDFNASQLTWIVIGLGSMGGTGYLTVDSKMTELSSKIEVANVKLTDNADKVAELKDQLIRIEDKLDKKQGKK
jgi:hypothetical protein